MSERKAAIASVFLVTPDPNVCYIHSFFFSCPADADLGDRDFASAVVGTLAQDMIAKGHTFKGRPINEFDVGHITLRELSRDELVEIAQVARDEVLE